MILVSMSLESNAVQVWCSKKKKNGIKMRNHTKDEHYTKVQ